MVSEPSIDQILELKTRHGIVIVAYDHQESLMTEAVADFTGDLLSLSEYAARAEAGTVVVCGAHFMAETVKLLCPEKRVLLAAREPSCVLADSIMPDDVRQVRGFCPGVPVIAYVNTSAAVKAEADICCTLTNVVAIASSFASERVILLPDRQLAEVVALATDIEVVTWRGECGEHTLLRPCSVCPHLKSLTLDDIATTIRDLNPQIEIDPVLAERARRPLVRMLSSF